MSRFNPLLLPPIPEKLAVVPRHGESWQRKYPHWWAGLTIASPTPAVAFPAAACVATVRQMARNQERLNEYYGEQTEWTRYWVREVLSLASQTPVLLEASGTAAILLISRMCAHVAAAQGASTFFTITTDEGGSLVPATLRGRDPNQLEKAMFQPGTGLFFQPEPVLAYPDGLQLLPYMVHVGGLDNAALLEELRRRLMAAWESGNTQGVIVLPHVVKSGRLLPIREVANLVAEMRQRGMQLFYLVDAVQSIGRTDAASITSPLDYCDAFVIGGSKALGGLLIASAVAARQDLVEQFVCLVENGSAGKTGWAAHFQFPPAFEARFPADVMKAGAVCLPETVAMATALLGHFFRGNGQTYEARRKNQLALVGEQRRQLMQGLATIEGLHVLQGSDGAPIVPSIVSFKPPNGITPAALKRALQTDDPIVTPGTPIGRYLRLDIPEYRELPSISVLVEKMQACIHELSKKSS